MEQHSEIKKERVINSCKSIDGPWKCFAKWKKSDTKGYMPHACLYLCDIKKTQNYEMEWWSVDGKYWEKGLELTTQ